MAKDGTKHEQDIVRAAGGDAVTFSLLLLRALLVAVDVVVDANVVMGDTWPHFSRRPRCRPSVAWTNLVRSCRYQASVEHNKHRVCDMSDE
jgi:hypothetical protein